jgi:uncharacterized protein (TIGR03084 family)
VPVDVLQLADDLAAETRELERLLEVLDAAGWERPTPAPGWAIRDQISHLAYFDEAATLAAVDPDRFRAERDAAFNADPAKPGSPPDVDGFTDGIAKRARVLDVAALHTWFRDARAAMVQALLSRDPGLRVPWYGPDMSIASSLTARIMETWAHGQDVADALDATRATTPALRQVAYIGVRTLPNSFVTRGLDVPDTPVYVALTSPGGESWTWGDAGATDRVEGDALAFCLVVTQRRHVADTNLVIQGPVAVQWMQIAQAFAGPPGAGRQPKGDRDG